MPLRLTSHRLIQSLISRPESGMGFQVLTVKLRDGTTSHGVVATDGLLTSWSGHWEPPFKEEDIGELVVSQAKGRGEPYKGSASGVSP
jgi:hypothetical protein